MSDLSLSQYRLTDRWGSRGSNRRRQSVPLLMTQKGCANRMLSVDAFGRSREVRHSGGVRPLEEPRPEITSTPSSPNCLYRGNTQAFSSHGVAQLRQV